MLASSSSSHDLDTVRRILRLLSDAGMNCWLFGGWAEELRGLFGSRQHQDIDLLFVSQHFDALTRMLADRRLMEIEGKRFHHKRAFVFENVMVELFLAETDGSGRFTMFWGDTRHDWPRDTFSQLFGMPVASAAALGDYRRAHGHLTRPHPRAAVQRA